MTSIKSLFPALGLISLFGANWPQWRGPEASGVSLESSLPMEWSETKNIAWKTELPGRGNSQPVIWGNKIFLTAEEDTGDAPSNYKPPVHHINGEVFLHPDSVGVNKLHRLSVIALDKGSGKILWKKAAYEGTVSDYRHKKGSYASPTPIVDGKTVFAYFGNEGLFAFDFDGKHLWSYQTEKVKTLGMGPGTSPAMNGNLLFLQSDDSEHTGSTISAIDKRTGKRVWKTERKEMFVSWSTPVIADANGGKELITTSMQSVVAYDPATGEELWRAPGVKGHAIATPVIGHGMAFLAAGYPVKYTYAVKLGGNGEATPVWSYDKGTAYVPSPILLGEYYYVMSDKGLLTCFDARTGEVKYEGKRPSKPGTFSGSPVAAGGKILITSEDGDTYIIKAGPEHEILAVNTVGEPVYASAAIADGRIYLRGEKHLFAIRK